jgi:hypothetical protein
MVRRSQAHSGAHGAAVRAALAAQGALLQGWLTKGATPMRGAAAAAPRTQAA